MKSLQNEFQFLAGFLAVIEQKNILTLCLKELKTDSIKLRGAIDVERNELILMRVYPSRNYLTAKLFISEVLKYCENKPKFVIDKAPWLKKALESLGLVFEHQTFRKEPKMSVYTWLCQEF